MIDDFAKDHLHGQLKAIREALIWKLDGLSEYDVRWVTPHETREQVLGFYRRAWRHADATIEELPLDAPGRVPWWSRPDVKLFNVIVHLLQETNRHAGHADILREQIDGRTGVLAAYEKEIDPAARAQYRAMIEQAAQKAAGGAGNPGRSTSHGVVETAP
ncbi:mycothiol transferase [Paractinoplanes rishiriensis]|uniref:Type I restriction endonuclease subunit M n=1 Tax=Paractinoplanes rishiriensis TaxID=1050105 RepID=A0A919K3E8_9ACTN|nr:DUF664 domain-containing protein [Actinoplanes rishiriensis]GIE98804.1 hypothetical protein Ari01nite_62690 [Actinoplanes rishiriensis]